MHEAGAFAAASNSCFIIGGIICSWTVDRFGRRPLMMFSAGGMSICFAFVTGLVSNADNSGALGTQMAIKQCTITVSSGVMLLADLNYDECDRMQQTMQQQWTNKRRAPPTATHLISLSPPSHLSL